MDTVEQIEAKHGFETLTIVNGGIYTEPGGKPSSRLMDTPPIRLKEKIDFAEKGGGKVEYRFRLSHHTCVLWRLCFSKFLPREVVEIFGNFMDVTAEAAEIGELLEKVKEAIIAANHDYANAIPRVKKRIEDCEHEVNSEGEKRASRLSFESLEI